MNFVDCKTALRTLKSGLPIIFPTDTLPAIGCLPKFSNISGFKGSITAEGIALDFPSAKILGPIPWGKSSGKASTIIFWKNSGNWKLIREGEVIVRELYKCFYYYFLFY